jgi:hypothetical protein
MKEKYFDPKNESGVYFRSFDGAKYSAVINLKKELKGEELVRKLKDACAEADLLIVDGTNDNIRGINPTAYSHYTCTDPSTHISYTFSRQEYWKLMINKGFTSTMTYIERKGLYKDVVLVPFSTITKKGVYRLATKVKEKLDDIIDD